METCVLFQLSLYTKDTHFISFHDYISKLTFYYNIFIFKLKNLPHEPVGKYIDDPDNLGKYVSNYLVDNFDDYIILKNTSKELNLTLPNCTVIGFDQETSEEWEMSGLGDTNLPGVICNSILEFLSDEGRFEVSLFFLSYPLLEIVLLTKQFL